MPKQDPCCARRQSQVVVAKGDLSRLSYRIQDAEQRNRSTDRLREKLPRLKAELAEAEQALVDHEAEHAGEVA